MMPGNYSKAHSLPLSDEVLSIVPAFAAGCWFAGHSLFGSRKPAFNFPFSHDF